MKAPNDTSANVTTNAGPASNASAVCRGKARFSIQTLVRAKTVLPAPPTSTMTGMSGNKAMAQAVPKNSPVPYWAARKKSMPALTSTVSNSQSRQ